MATRTIVTAQPDVMCDVCERRLLRGEQPDVFIAAGRRRIVCELCAPRAAHEGWLRESDSQSLSLPPARARRGRSLLDRLRQVARPEQETGVQPYDVFAEEPIGGAHGEPQASSHQHDGQGDVQPPASAFHDGGSETAATPDPADDPAVVRDNRVADPARSGLRTDDQDISYLQDAIGMFNASEFPRRVAGVARSLGAPSVSVRCAEHLSSVVSIVVAWELCWYRYQVDLSEPVVEAQLIAQGTELGELEREERTANAAVAESGSLALTAL